MYAVGGLLGFVFGCISCGSVHQTCSLYLALFAILNFTGTVSSPTDKEEIKQSSVAEIKLLSS
jgi:hypothetical protein